MFDEKEFQHLHMEEIQLAFLDKEKFSWATSDTCVFLLQLQKRIQAFYPEFDVEDQKDNMIMRFSCELQTAIKTLACGVTDISELISASLRNRNLTLNACFTPHYQLDCIALLNALPWSITVKPKFALTQEHEVVWCLVIILKR